jgi:hypothetical protein
MKPKVIFCVPHPDMDAYEKEKCHPERNTIKVVRCACCNNHFLISVTSISDPALYKNIEAIAFVNNKSAN